MEALLDQLDVSLYGTNTTLLCNRLRSSYRVVEHDGERLPDIYRRFLRDKQFYSLFVRSHMGSGKTYQLKKIISNLRQSARSTRTELRVLIITPKRTFASYVASQLTDFVDYRNVRRPYNCNRHPRLVIQLQSLKNFDEIDNDSFSIRGYSVVILDETHSIVDELFSDLSDPKEKRKNILLFIKVLRSIPRWICLDAHLSLDLINIFKEIDDESERTKSHICLINRFRRNDFKLVFHRKCLFNSLVVRQLKQKLYQSDTFRKYKPLLCTQKIADIVLEDNVGLVEKLYKKIYIRDFLNTSDQNDILVELHDALRRGYKICVTTATKRQAIMLKSLFSSCQFKVKMITGDTSEEIKSKFASDPDRFIEGCQLFIYTTAFQVGIDVCSKRTYFDTHFVFIECSTKVASPGAFVQAVGRIRTLKSNEYKIVVVDTTAEKSDKAVSCLTMNDLLPKTRDQILPTGKSNSTTNSVCNMLVDLHHKEKAIGNNVFLYVNMFIRLLSCKAEPYVLINGNIYPVDDVVNFQSFQYSKKEYGKFIDNFICAYEEEIQKTLDKHINKIWRKLESSSIYVSTVVNNFDAFLKMPGDLSRSECLLKVCEFTNMPFGFLHTYVFATVSHIDNHADKELTKRYFEIGLRSYYHQCSLADLDRLKALVLKFLETTCSNKESCYWKINVTQYLDMLQCEQSDIVLCYSRFVNKVVGKTATTRQLFEKLMAKSMRLYIHKDVLDLNDIYTYKRVISTNKLLVYNVKRLSGFS